MLMVKERRQFVATMRYVHLWLMETMAAWVPTTPEIEVKLLFGEHIWDVAQHVDALGKRTSELCLPPQHSMRPAHSYVDFLTEQATIVSTSQRISVVYDVLLPALAARYRCYLDRTDTLSDAPTVRILEYYFTDTTRMIEASRVVRQACPLLQLTDRAWAEALAAREGAIDFLSASIPEAAVSDRRPIRSSTRMTTRPNAASLDPTLFADEPARDARFTVVEHWAECANFPEGHPQREIEFLHRQMNEECDSLECAASNLRDFPQVDWGLRLWLARQCADEARHAAMFRRLFETRGGRVGQYPVLNFQYRIITHIRSLVGRLAVQNRSFEAGGLDAIARGIEEARQRGDEALAALFEAQRADEIVHVRFANDAIRNATQHDPRSVLQIATAITTASKAFFQVMGPEGTAGVRYPTDVDGRLEAGFTEDEVRLAIQLQEQPTDRLPLEKSSG